MRRLLVVPVLAALLAAGCGDDEPEALSAEEAQEVVDRALLELEDFDEGWELTETEPAGSDDEEGDAEFEECLGSDFDIEEATIAESESRTFSRSPSDTETQQVAVSAGALESIDQTDELFDLVTSQQFATCMTDLVRSEIAADAGAAGVQVEIGAPQLDDDYVDDAERSARVGASLAMSAGPLSFEGRLDILVVSEANVTSLVTVFALGEPIPNADLEAWSELLADRLAA